MVLCTYSLGTLEVGSAVMVEVVDKVIDLHPPIICRRHVFRFFVWLTTERQTHPDFIESAPRHSCSTQAWCRDVGAPFFCLPQITALVETESCDEDHNSKEFKKLRHINGGPSLLSQLLVGFGNQAPQGAGWEAGKKVVQAGSVGIFIVGGAVVCSIVAHKLPCNRFKAPVHVFVIIFTDIVPVVEVFVVRAGIVGNWETFVSCFVIGLSC